MHDFSFTNVKEILVKDWGAKQIGSLIRERFGDVENVMLVTDAGLMRLGFPVRVTQSLAMEGLAVTLYTGVEADPSEENIFEAIETAKERQVDLVIGLGGGSSMDVAKLVAVFADPSQPQDFKDCYGVNKVTGKRLALVQIPTTAGSGSECTAVAIVTTGADSKMGIVSPLLFADVALLDATLTLGLPANITAYTAIDAMVHGIEAFTSVHKKNPLSDMAACRALSLIGDNFAAVMQDGSDLDARRNVLIGASLAGSAFANAPVAAVHALAYPLGAVHHIPHGLSNALMLPAVLAYNKSAAADLYAQLAINQGVGTSADDFIDFMKSLIALSGQPTRLRDVGVAEDGLERLASDSQLQTRLLVNNPRPVPYDAALALYKEVW